MKAGKREIRKDGIRRALSGEGYYPRRAAGAAGVWRGSAALALLCTLVSYPGIWYSDSYVRVTTGGAVLNAVVKALTGHRILLETHNAFSVIPSFFMAASIGLTGHVGLYTFLQAFAFFSAVFLLIRELKPAYRKLQYLLFALSPVIFGASVYYEANIGSAAGMIALLLLFRRVREEKTRTERGIEFLLIAFASFVTFGYRTNALTVVPVLAVYLWKIRTEKTRKVLPALALVCGLLLVKAVPWAFGVKSLSNGGTGFVWEIITTIQRMDPSDRAAYEDYLDDIGGEGATAAVLQSSTEASANDFMWGGALNAETMSAPGAMSGILGKYFRLIREKPADWLRVKGDFLRRAMGIGEALDISEYDYNRWDAMGEYGLNDSLQRKWFHASYLGMNRVFGFFTLHPWASFLISLILVSAEWIRKSGKRELYALLMWTAVFYYGAYLAVIVGFELRFFYPSLLLMMIMDAAIVLDWVKSGAALLRRRTAGRRS